MEKNNKKDINQENIIVSEDEELKEVEELLTCVSVECGW